MYIPFVVILNGLNYEKKARRKSWPASDEYVKIINPTHRPIIFALPDMEMKMTLGFQIYNPTQADKLAKDWQFV
jgi:hypothetical protein